MINFVKKIPDGAIFSYEQPTVMQLNITRKCNIACKHCHLKCSPASTEDMNLKTAETCVKVFKNYNFKTMDITGGSPEMSEVFDFLVEEGKKIAENLIVRSNLTLWDKKEYEYIPEFLAKNKAVIFASLPSPKALLTDRQRGKGVYEKIISNLKVLNKLGYGKNLELNLVHNPTGAFMPSGQENLEFEYRKILDSMEIKFNNLFCITNLPIGRFREFLKKNDIYDDYMETLCKAYNPEALDNVMCKDMISVDYDGSLYDCDFNLAENASINGNAKTIFDLEKNPEFVREIRCFDYCYACTAGQGSSCGGQTV